MMRPGPALVTLLYAAAGVAWILLSEVFVYAFTDDPLLQSRLEVAKGLGFVAVTSAVLFLLLRAQRPATAGATPDDRRGHRFAAAILALSVLVIGGSVYVLQARQAERDTFSDLRVIAQFKVLHIENWLDERRNDARALTGNAEFVEQATAVLDGSGNETRRGMLRDRLASLRDAFGYEAIALLDARGEILAAAGDPRPDHGVAAGASRTETAVEVRMTDLHADAAGRTLLHFTARIPGTAGVVRFDVDPNRFLFPLVRSWPTASASGEAFLLRRDGDQVLFLNTLRRQADGASTLRQPLAAKTLPAAIALRAAGAGIAPGVDYRGVPVFAAWQPVGATSWVLVAKMDREEALAGARGTALWIAGVAALSLSLVAYTLLLLLRQQRLAQELARDARAGRFALALGEVIAFQEAGAASLGALAPRVTEAAANAAGAARANLWLFNEGETQLRCIDHFDAVGGEHSSGALLEETQYRSEFQALKSADHVDAADALSDPRTAGYAEGYLKPLGIMSMLDAVINVSGRHLGLLCIEHVGRRHRWTPEEITFASRLADRVGLAILNRDRREVQDSLHRSHALLESTERLGGIGGWTMDLDNDAVLCSDETYRICGIEPGVVVRRSDLFALLHPDDRARVTTAFDDGLAGGAPGPLEVRIVRRDGGQRVCKVQGEVVRDAQGKPERVSGTLHDVTVLKAAESRVLHLNGLYLTLSRCNVAMVRSRSVQEMFDEVCRVVVQSGGIALAWVSLADPETLQVRSAAGFAASEASLGYLDAIRVSVDAAEPQGRGPTGTAIRDGEPYWCQDFAADPRTEPWRDAAARFGWRASAALPLRRGGRIVGALTFYMTEPNAFDEEMRSLLSEIASEVSFSLDNFDREAAHASAVDRLRESEERYRLLIDHSQDAILLIAPDDRILSANAAACRTFGCSEAELTAGGRTTIVDTTDPHLTAALEERARTGSFRGELTMVRHNGETFPAEVSTSVFTDHAGEPRSSMIIRDISEQKRVTERLAHLAQHDALTDLPNRLLLTDRLNVALARAQRSGKPLALLFLDLDRFKNVNDALGHEQGDRLLVEAAARLKACVRASDTVSRQGGDEFLVLLADIESAQDAARVSQKLIEAVSRTYELGGAEFVLTASIGIACHPENGADAETLMRNADAAMYVAKQGGRNRYQFYSAEMNARARDRLRLETDLRQAITRRELFVVYQPQLDLGSGQVVGAEALVRWQHPQLGLVPPADFIGIAEDSGQIVAIGAWVLETACRQQAAWVAEGLTAGVIAVNVSAHQFRQIEFAETVTATLAASGLRAEHLELEVTESALMHGVEDMLRKLGQLDHLGVKLSIDDFGTGYSSLSYLKQFPIYRLKIDQSFTCGLPNDTGSGAIAQAVISLGHSLGLNVLAEGVETKAQEEHLRALSCDAVQGYLYSKPVPADAYAAFLRARATPSRD